jgi:hypothetical protein
MGDLRLRALAIFNWRTAPVQPWWFALPKPAPARGYLFGI